MIFPKWLPKNKELSHEDIYKIVLETLEDHRELTIDKLERSSQPEKKADDTKPLFKKPHAHNAKVFKNHDCEKSSQCRPDWDLLGCIMLYKIKKIDERVELMKENKLCF